MCEDQFSDGMVFDCDQTAKTNRKQPTINFLEYKKMCSLATEQNTKWFSLCPGETSTVVLTIDKIHIHTFVWWLNQENAHFNALGECSSRCVELEEFT